MDDDYGPIVMEHFINPRNVGELPSPSAVGSIRNGVCGDFTKLFLRIDGDRIVEAKFRTFGCGAAIAASSILTEMVRGKTLSEVTAVTQDVLTTALGGLPETKVHCAVLAEDALKAALADYRARSLACASS